MSEETGGPQVPSEAAAGDSSAPDASSNNGDGNTTDATESGEDTTEAPADAPSEAPVARPQPPAMTPKEVTDPARQYAAYTIYCDLSCGQERCLYRGDTLPVDPDAPEPGTSDTDPGGLGDPAEVVRRAAGCRDTPRACVGATGGSDSRDAMTDAQIVTPPPPVGAEMTRIAGIPLTELDTPGGDQPDTAGEEVAPQPLQPASAMFPMGAEPGEPLVGAAPPPSARPVWSTAMTGADLLVALGVAPTVAAAAEHGAMGLPEPVEATRVDDPPESG